MEEPARAAARRSRATTLRNCKLGPLRFTPVEMAAVKRAAARDGVTAGAWAAGRLVALAHQELVVMPVSDRDLMQELARARADLARLGIHLQRVETTGRTSANGPALDETLKQVSRAIDRVQAASDVITAKEVARRNRTVP